MKHIPLPTREIARKYRNGATLRELGAEYRVNYQTIRTRLLGARTKMRHEGPRPTGPADPRRLALARRLRAKGYSLRVIGGRLGISRQRVFQLLARYGAEP